MCWSFKMGKITRGMDCAKYNGIMCHMDGPLDFTGCTTRFLALPMVHKHEYNKVTFLYAYLLSMRVLYLSFRKASGKNSSFPTQAGPFDMELHNTDLI